MQSDEAMIAVVSALDAQHIPYMLVGSFATNVYGVPRSTQDADIVAQLQPGDVTALAQRLGPPFRLDPQMTFETVTATTRYVLRLDDDPFTIELFLLSDDPHDRERFARRRREQIPRGNVFIPTVEDVIISKIRWLRAAGRRKDIEDVENVIAVQGDRIDWEYVNHWCDCHETRELLDKVRRSLKTA